MDDSKETLDELFHYGEKILTELENAAADKSAKLEDAQKNWAKFQQEAADKSKQLEDARKNLAKIQQEAADKSTKLSKSESRYANLKKVLQGILNQQRED